MLIQSTFKDYYDGANSAGIDTSIIYKRTTTQVQLDEGFFIDGLPEYFPDELGEERYFSGKSIEGRNYCKWMIIGFCGVHYVGVFNTLADHETQHTMAYFGEDILQLDWQTPKTFWRYDKPKIVIEQLLKQWHLKEENNLFAKFQAPTFTKQIQHSLSKYEWKNKQLYLEMFEINPCLNNYKFFKVQNTFTAFQSLQTYISGVLGSKENDIIELSNKSKIIKAGFDLKTSFRKSKEK